MSTPKRQKKQTVSRTEHNAGTVHATMDGSDARVVEEMHLLGCANGVSTELTKSKLAILVATPSKDFARLCPVRHDNSPPPHAT